MSKINRVGQKFYGNPTNCAPSVVFEVIGELIGDTRWLVKDSNRFQYSMNHNGSYVSGGRESSVLLGKEIVPLKLEKGQFYKLNNGEIVLVYAKNTEGNFLTMTPKYPTATHSFYSGDGKYLSGYSSPTTSEVALKSIDREALPSEY